MWFKGLWIIKRLSDLGPIFNIKYQIGLNPAIMQILMQLLNENYIIRFRLAYDGETILIYGDHNHMDI